MRNLTERVSILFSDAAVGCGAVPSCTRLCRYVDARLGSEKEKVRRRQKQREKKQAKKKVKKKITSVSPSVKKNRSWSSCFSGGKTSGGWVRGHARYGQSATQKKKNMRVGVRYLVLAAVTPSGARCTAPIEDVALWLYCPIWTP